MAWRWCRWPRRRAAVLAERAFNGATHAKIIEQLGLLLSESSTVGCPVTVVLSDELVRMWQVTPPPAASRLADLEAAAALRFQSLFGMPAAAWKISADWHAERPFLAAAVPQDLLEHLEQAAREHRFHLVEIVPQFVAAMNQWRKRRRQNAWFGVLQAGVLTIAAFEGRALAALRTAPVPAHADRAWLEDFIARETLRLGIAHPTCLQICGLAPASWGSPAGAQPFACDLLDTAPGENQSLAARLAWTGGAQ
jgi:hypothetical protein